ncbi:MAG: FAD-containing monooxygenase EthA, partial [Mycobacterium sp.]
LQAFGGISLTVDGTPVNLPDHVAYKGMMLSDVPNFAYAIGYTNSSWTLKVGLLCEHLCRLLAYMDANGFDTARPVLDDPNMDTRPLLDFGAGYVQRAVHQFPRQGEGQPWLTSMSYYTDVKSLRNADVVDPALKLTSSADVRSREAVPA